ncbi:MAG: hypothetical protein K1X42_02390 [Opitutaceae bacterium]|nr:hypothetical protein [Opitutaceae bacterium]
MTAPLPPRQIAFLAHVPADGSAIGNAALRAKIGYRKAAYAAVRYELITAVRVHGRTPVSDNLA